MSPLHLLPLDQLAHRFPLVTALPASQQLLNPPKSDLVFSGLVVATAWKDGTPLGAPRYWPWLLTGLQVMALWSAGKGRWWGWLLGGSVQVPWIVYAVVTTQLGFIPGCAVSAAVQTHSFLLCGRSHTMPVVESSAGAAKEEIT
ncbi:MAG: hypothetical protein ACREMZ_16965 [Gemmatimonadales bacterium]